MDFLYGVWCGYDFEGYDYKVIICKNKCYRV